MKPRIRDPNEKELKTIRKALGAFGKKDFLADKRILIAEYKNKKEVYFLSPELHDFLKEGLRNGNLKSIVCAGIKLGEVGKRFRLTLEGAYYLSSKKKRVYVNERGEMLFLYGRDIFSESVVKVSESIKENDIVFVCNKHGDVLGIGKSRYDGRIMRSVEKDRVVVENLVDRGEYLRKEKLYNAY
ncbi:Protein involved in ribosomal biogenesis, contains PUA domain [Archaeoglobus sulfaticallidus PM70-1]|uniref:Protein involved in ribosomal biogenesis, contains PUA domain n=1 Tax=Archaeoglobus sulfaticallidus PM70-1 TaxID=387631 RepID=N0BG32_9EURY|nr:PUA domain-containing protein [Archaeoglobus sulfaticallidus]AGK61968.1 Protein involved in ribosomal biogenesis, contains PUA domain [Archaeoglobus sulfaticallidus PM70-1]